MTHFDGYCNSIKHQYFEYFERAAFVFVCVCLFVSDSDNLIDCAVCTVLNVCICICEYLIDCGVSALCAILKNLSRIPSPRPDVGAIG